MRILVPGNHTDALPVQAAGRSYYEELLSAGVRIFEFQPAMMHAKAAVVDSAWSIVGSANLDERSMELNEENVLGIADSDFAQVDRGGAHGGLWSLEGDPAGGLAEALDFHAAEWRGLVRS